VTVIQFIVKRRWWNSWSRGLSSNAIGIRVTTATTWHVPAVRSRHEQLKPERLGCRRCRDELVGRRACLMMASDDRCLDSRSAQVVGRQLGS